MQCSAHPQALKKAKGVTNTHVPHKGLFPLHAANGEQINTHLGHHIDDTQQLFHTFKFCTTSLYISANAIFMSSDTAGTSC